MNEPIHCRTPDAGSSHSRDHSNNNLRENRITLAMSEIFIAVMLERQRTDPLNTCKT